MENDLERAARHGIDRLRRNMRLSQVQHRAREEEADLASMLGDAAATLEPLESAFDAAERTRVENGDTVSRLEVLAMIESSLKSVSDQMKKAITLPLKRTVVDALEQFPDKCRAGQDDGPILRPLKGLR